MQPRTTIPGDIHQSAINAANNAKRAATALERSATYQSMRLAEIDMRRAKAELSASLMGLRVLMREAARA